MANLYFVTVDLRTSYCYCGGNYGSAAWTSEAWCTHYCPGTTQRCGYSSNRYSVFEVGSEDCELQGKLRYNLIGYSNNSCFSVREINVWGPHREQKQVVVHESWWNILIRPHIPVSANFTVHDNWCSTLLSSLGLRGLTFLRVTPNTWAHSLHYVTFWHQPSLLLQNLPVKETL